MKILCFFRVSPLFEPELVFGGAERRFIEITKVWASVGNEIHVIGSDSACKLCQKFGLKATMYVHNPTSVKSMGLDSFLDVQKMLKRVPEREFDFIYSSGENFRCVVASALAKRKLKVPLVTSFNLLHSEEINTLHSFMRTFRPNVRRAERKVVYFKSLPRKSLQVSKTWMRNLFLKKMDLIFSVSNYIKILLQKMGINRERIFTVAGGINYDFIQSVGSEEKIYDACFLGTIEARKGIVDLVELWRRVVKEKPEAKLIIMGTGKPSYVENIRALLRKHSLENNVTMTGFVRGKQKYKKMKQSKIFVFPSYAESFGQVICEAMACGLPVIAYDLPVYKEWWGNDIIYVKRGDVSSLINVTLDLLEDATLRRKMKNMGLKRAKRYIWRNVAEYELEIITQKLLTP